MVGLNLGEELLEQGVWLDIRYRFWRRWRRNDLLRHLSSLLQIRLIQLDNCSGEDSVA